MNAEEQTEWNYRFAERLGILCGPLPPTEAQKQMARDEANEAIERLRGSQMTFPLNDGGK